MNFKVVELNRTVNNKSKLNTKEPALNTGTHITGLVVLITLFLNLFPHHFSDKWVAIIYGLAALLGPLLTAGLTRHKVWSPASVKELVDEVTQELKAVPKPPPGKRVNPKLL